MCVVRDQPDGTYTCLACRVLGTPVRECAHRQSLGVCRNRANHRSDVVYFRNTGVPTINGCGFCKWAKEYPPPPGTQLPNNPGWPGCCRAPRPEDAPLIDKDNYNAIVAAWDQRALPQSVSTIRGAPAARRSPIPQFSEKGAPEPSRTPPLSAGARRTDPARRERDDRYGSRRQGSYEAPQPTAPVRQGSYDQSRHGTIRGTSTAQSYARQSNGPVVPPPPAEPLNLSSLSASLPALRASKAMSDSGSESSNTTVGTDSTDYLSDESEEELQRLAVARAIAIERQQREEAEYESARRGLRDIDVTTPVQWGMNGGGAGGAGGGNPSVRSMQYLSFGDVAQAQYGGARRQR